MVIKQTPLAQFGWALYYGRILNFTRGLMNVVYSIVFSAFFVLALFVWLLFRGKQKQAELKAMLAHVNEQNDFSRVLQEKINGLLVEQQRQSSAQQLQGLKVIYLQIGS